MKRKTRKPNASGLANPDCAMCARSLPIIEAVLVCATCMGQGVCDEHLKGLLSVARDGWDL